jgi:phage terminase large subunit-like protein
VRPKGKYELLAEARQARDLELSQQPGGHPKGFRFDPAAGDRVIQFLERYCKHHKGEWAGRPLLLEPWQKDQVQQAFGWLRADGTRRFRTCYWEIARKNGKSEIAGGLGLYLTVGDQEPGAEVYSSATKKDQAKIVWDNGAAMVKASPELRRFLKVYRSNMHCARLGSKFEPLGADSHTLDGLNPHGNIVDELHAHKDRGVWDVLDTAMGARRQPMTIAITTAGTYDPHAIGWEMHDYACKVLEEVVEDDSFHAFIASAHEGEETEKILRENPDYYFSLEAQQKANPNFGVSVKPDYMARQAAKAKAQPSFANEYLRLHLNVWTQQVTKWLSLTEWNACDPIPGTSPDVRTVALEREKQLERRVCFGGLDLASKLDLCALVLAFPGEGDLVDLVCRFWLPEATVDKYAQKGRKHYQQWADEGWLTLTPGDVIDYEFIRAEVNALAKRFKLQDLGFDPAGATDLSTRLMGDGIQMVETRQGYLTLSEPSKDLEARVVSGKVRHAGNPILRFCVSNAVINRDSAGNIKPDKSKAADKIDGVIATVVALSRLIRVKPKEPESYLARQPIVVLG